MGVSNENCDQLLQLRAKVSTEKETEYQIQYATISSLDLKTHLN